MEKDNFHKNHQKVIELADSVTDMQHTWLQKSSALAISRTRIHLNVGLHIIHYKDIFLQKYFI
jgi:hypothetical protein